MLACKIGKHFLPDYRDRFKRGEFCPINWEACRRSFISFLSSVVEPAPEARLDRVTNRRGGSISILNMDFLELL